MLSPNHSGGQEFSRFLHPQGLLSLSPGYNVCILRGYSDSDSFVMFISDQMALRMPVFAPSILTLQAVTVVLWKVNSACNIHSRVQPALLTSTCSCWITSAIWMWSHCRPAGSWMDIPTDYCTCWAQCVGGVPLHSVVVCATFPHP